MGRKPSFSEPEIVAQALELAADGGPSAVTMKAVAGAVGAPSGSIYHRFSSRPHLLGAVWVEALNLFRTAWVPAAARATTPGEIAVIPVRWARSNRTPARVLMLYAAEDFVGTDTPETIRRSVTELQRMTRDSLVDMAERWLRRSDAAALHRTTFALTEIPLAALRRPLKTDQPIPRAVEDLVRQAADHLMSEGYQ